MIIIALLGVWIFLISYVMVFMQYWPRFHEVEEMKMELDEINAEFERLEQKQKEAKLGNLLTSMRKKGIIKTSDSNQQKSYWILA